MKIGIAGRDIDAIRVHRLGHCTIVGDYRAGFRVNGLYDLKVAVVAAMTADYLLKKGGYDE
jgi:hypothetical protein